MTGKGIPHPVSCPGSARYNNKLGGGGARRMSRQKAAACRNLNKIIAEQDMAAQQQVTYKSHIMLIFIVIGNLYRTV